MEENYDTCRIRYAKVNGAMNNIGKGSLRPIWYLYRYVKVSWGGWSSLANQTIKWHTKVWKDVK